MAAKFSFTKRRLEALAAPADDRVYCQDEAAEGLFLCVTRAGTKTFYVYKKFQGRPVRVPLGRFPTLSVEEARKACRAMIVDLRNGVDVQHARHTARREQTIKGLWEHWIEHAKQHKRTWGQDERKFDRFLATWGNRRLSAVRKADVQALHTKIGAEHGHYLANRVVNLIASMYAKAGDIGYKGDNPAKGVTMFREEKRDRFLSGDELPRFFQALAVEPNEVLRDFILLSLLTGARRSNVQAMKWADVQVDAAIWRISGDEAKAGIPINIPLSPPALAVLKTRRTARSGSPYVFPSKGSTGHIVEPKSAWKRILKKAGLQDVRIHDLRRSLGSWQAMRGASLSIIGKSLGHTQSRTTEIYARLSLDPVRQSVDSATAAMLTAGGATVNGDGITIDVQATEGNDNGKA